jgi:Ca2+/Na+ antiporter
MNDLLSRIVGFSLYGIPLIGIEYLLIKTLLKQIRMNRKMSKAEAVQRRLKRQIRVTAVGVFCGAFLIVNLFLFVFHLSVVPALLLIVMMIGFVPYVFFVYRTTNATEKTGIPSRSEEGDTGSKQ